MLLEEVGPQRDVPKAMRLLEFEANEQRGSAKYHTDAQYLLSFQLLHLEPCRAITLLKSASSEHHVEATFRLACLVADGKVLDSAHAEAVTMFMTVAAKGHVNACLRLAAMHELGECVAQSNYTAAMFYWLAAEKGSSNAQCRLACLHKEGRGVVQSRTKSLVLHRPAANQSSAQAQHDLADVNLAVRARSEAIRCFHKSCSARAWGSGVGIEVPQSVGRGLGLNSIKQ